MSNLLKEKQALAKLREELEGRKERLCRYCKRFRHLAQNCRNKEEKKKRGAAPQNKFEILKSRVMQCGKEGKMIRKQEVAVVECFKYRKKGHKCRECPLWEKVERRRGEERVACVARLQEVQQKEWRRSPVKGCKRKLYTGTNKTIMF